MIAQNLGPEDEFKIPDTQIHLNATAKNATPLEDQKITAGELYIQEMKKKAQTPGEGELNPQHEGKFQVPDIYYFDFDRPGLEKPWKESFEKNDEYFNYGM
jgi:hypothetical protein